MAICRCGLLMVVRQTFDWRLTGVQVTNTVQYPFSTVGELTGQLGVSNRCEHLCLFLMLTCFTFPCRIPCSCADVICTSIAF
jgi:hypothetical protein